MSWWNIDKDDVIGDRPADIVGDTLAAIAKARRAQDRPLPRLQDIVDAIAVAFERSPETFKRKDESSKERIPATPRRAASAARVTAGTHSLTNPNGNGHMTLPRVVVELSSGASVVSKRESIADDVIVAAFMRALMEIADAYLDRWGRRPRRREVLYTVKFVLRPDPGEYIADPPYSSVTIKSISAEWPALSEPLLGVGIPSTT